MKIGSHCAATVNRGVRIRAYDIKRLLKICKNNNNSSNNNNNELTTGRYSRITRVNQSLKFDKDNNQVCTQFAKI